MTEPLLGWTSATAGERARAVLAAGGAFLFYTSLDLFGNETWSTPEPSLWVAGFVAIAAATALADPERLPRLGSPLLAWILGFFLLTTLWGVFMPGLPHVRQVAVDRYRSIALVLAFLVLLQEDVARRAALLGTVAGVALGCLLNVAEAVGVVRFPEDELRIAGRSAGLYVNSNVAGITICLGLAAVVGSIPRRWRVPLLAAGAAAVALTFSRSSALAFAALLVALTWSGVVRVRWVLAVALAAACALMYYGPEVADYLERTGVLNSNTWSRLRLANDDSGRLAVAARTWELFLDAPLLGNGIGATSDWDFGIQPHNLYLYFAADHGVLGLLVLPALAAALAVRGRSAVPFAVVLLLGGVFSHNLLVNRALLILLALVEVQGRPRAAAERWRVAPAVAGAERGAG